MDLAEMARATLKRCVFRETGRGKPGIILSGEAPAVLVDQTASLTCEDCLFEQNHGLAMMFKKDKEDSTALGFGEDGLPAEPSLAACLRMFAEAQGTSYEAVCAKVHASQAKSSSAPTGKHSVESCGFKQNGLSLERARRHSSYTGPEPYHDPVKTKIGQALARAEAEEEEQRLGRNAGKSEYDLLGEMKGSMGADWGKLKTQMQGTEVMPDPD